MCPLEEQRHRGYKGPREELQSVEELPSVVGRKVGETTSRVGSELVPVYVRCLLPRRLCCFLRPHVEILTNHLDNGGDKMMGGGGA